MTPTRSTRGFALLMVLLVVALAGTVLAMAARRSCTLATEAAAAQQRLQTDWGAQSIRASLLPKAEAVLAADTPEKGRAPASARRALVLGGVRFNLLFGDEQAKANVNLLEQRHGHQGLDMRLQTLQEDPRQRVRVDLRPGPDQPVARGAPPMRYWSLDQVFLFSRPADLVDAGATCAATGPITLWSSGPVNFRRASRAVLREVLAGAMPDSQIEELVRAAETSPRESLGDALRQAGGDGRQMQAARQLLAETSACHSLWVVAHGTTRNWYRLYVERAGETKNGPTGWAFEW